MLLFSIPRENTKIFRIGLGVGKHQSIGTLLEHILQQHEP